MFCQQLDVDFADTRQDIGIEDAREGDVPILPADPVCDPGVEQILDGKGVLLKTGLQVGSRLDCRFRLERGFNSKRPRPSDGRDPPL